MNQIFGCLLVTLFVLVSAPAHAGLLDKLNEATKKLNDYNARQQGSVSGNQNQPASVATGEAESEDRPYDLNKQKGFKGSCEGKRSATCMDYMEAMDYCMDPIRGYRSKLYIGLIEKKLKEEKLDDKQRKNLQEDLAAFKEAHKNKSDDPVIAGKKSQRYLEDVSEDDQVWVNAEYNKFHTKINNKCTGADHMGIGKRTEFGGPTMSGDEAVKEMKAKKAKDAEPFECLKKTQYVRWAIMADLMEKRMNERKLAGKERADWEADIASLREFAETGEGKMPKAVDPNNPMRSMMRLTDMADQTYIANESAKRSQEMMDECQAKGPKRERAKLTGTTSQVLAARKIQDKKDAENEAIYQREKANRGSGGSLSASLGATDLRYMKTAVKCYDPLKGHMAKVTADMLDKRLKEAKNLTVEKRRMWQADIIAWREAQAAGADQPDPPDPDDPYRWHDYISKQDRQEINTQHSKFVNEINKKCNAVDHMNAKSE
jgi:hypothetical protein